jgi:hypothetical protein
MFEGNMLGLQMREASPEADLWACDIALRTIAVLTLGGRGR